MRVCECNRTLYNGELTHRIHEKRLWLCMNNRTGRRRSVYLNLVAKLSKDETCAHLLVNDLGSRMGNDVMFIAFFSTYYVSSRVFITFTQQ